MEFPSFRLWEAAKEILRYLNSVKEEGITFVKSGNALPEAYIDSDWAGCEDSRKSTSGLIILLANAPSKCKLQICVS